MGYFGDGGNLAAPRRMSPYPSPIASPEVRYTDLELDSDLTLGNGDNRSGSESNLGDPLVVLLSVVRLR